MIPDGAKRSLFGHQQNPQRQTTQPLGKLRHREMPANTNAHPVHSITTRPLGTHLGTRSTETRLSKVPCRPETCPWRNDPSNAPGFSTSVSKSKTRTRIYKERILAAIPDSVRNQITRPPGNHLGTRSTETRWNKVPSDQKHVLGGNDPSTAARFSTSAGDCQ